MAFAKEEGAYEIIKEGNEEVMRIDYGDKSFPPSLEDSKLCMADTVDKIIEAPQVTRVIFTLMKNYQYDADQVSMLREIANLYVHLVKQKKVLSFGTFDVDYSAKYGMIQYIVLNLFKGDPLGAYVEVKRLIREQKIKMKDLEENAFRREKEFLDLLIYIYDVLDKTKLIEAAKSELDGYSVGDRTLYRKMFRAIITPNFLFTRLMAEPPLEDEEVDTYSVDDIDVMIFKMTGDVRYKYHVVPPEFKIDEEKHILIDIARNVLAEHKPEAEEFIDPEKMRYNFFNIGRDLLSDVAEHKGIELSYEEAEELARILVRYTVGFGLIEVLLQDPKIQDISVNGPIGETPIFVVHEDYGDCVTNIIPSREDGEGWATRFRLISGRPLDEANPVLDTGLTIPGARARVAVITNPLNPLGFGYAFRRHRDKPWTLPLFINNRMINSLTAGLISFLVDGGRAMLLAGTRSSGKTSILGSVMVELMRRYRILTLEDTLELPTDFLRKQGYNIQPMKVRSALTRGGGEMAADEGIRTSLRMGDSSLIIGEVRSVEAMALFEAMRTGSLANLVAGTIHGESAYGVFDRVVNDLGVPRTSFKATDVVIVANPIKTADRLSSVKRVVSLTEVRKEWEEDPLKEGAFVDLLKYNVKSDQLEATQDLINGDSDIVKAIAANVKEWAGNWDAVWNNIMLRAKVKQLLVDYANRSKNLDFLEAGFVIKANDRFHRVCESVREENGYLDNKRILFEWTDWLKKQMREIVR